MISQKEIDNGYVFIDPPEIKIRITCPWCGKAIKGKTEVCSGIIEIWPEECGCHHD